MLRIAEALQRRGSLSGAVVEGRSGGECRSPRSLAAAPSNFTPVRSREGSRMSEPLPDPRSLRRAIDQIDQLKKELKSEGLKAAKWCIWQRRRASPLMRSSRTNIGRGEAAPLTSPPRPKHKAPLPRERFAQAAIRVERVHRSRRWRLVGWVPNVAPICRNAVAGHDRP